VHTISDADASCMAQFLIENPGKELISLSTATLEMSKTFIEMGLNNSECASICVYA